MGKEEESEETPEFQEYKRQIATGAIPDRIREELNIIPEDAEVSVRFQAYADNLITAILKTPSAQKKLKRAGVEIDPENHGFRCVLSSDSSPNAARFKYANPPLFIFSTGLFSMLMEEFDAGVINEDEFIACLTHEINHQLNAYIHGEVNNSKSEEALSDNLMVDVLHDLERNVGSAKSLLQKIKGEGDFISLSFFDPHPDINTRIHLVDTAIAGLDIEDKYEKTIVAGGLSREIADSQSEYESPVNRILQERDFANLAFPQQLALLKEIAEEFFDHEKPNKRVLRDFLGAVELCSKYIEDQTKDYVLDEGFKYSLLQQQDQQALDDFVEFLCASEDDKSLPQYYQAIYQTLARGYRDSFRSRADHSPNMVAIGEIEEMYMAYQTFFESTDSEEIAQAAETFVRLYNKYTKEGESIIISASGSGENKYEHQNLFPDWCHRKAKPVDNKIIPYWQHPVTAALETGSTEVLEVLHIFRITPQFDRRLETVDFPPAGAAEQLPMHLTFHISQEVIDGEIYEFGYDDQGTPIYDLREIDQELRIPRRSYDRGLGENGRQGYQEYVDHEQEYISARVAAEEKKVVEVDWSELERDFDGFVGKYYFWLQPNLTINAVGIEQNHSPFAERFCSEAQKLLDSDPSRTSEPCLKAINFFSFHGEGQLRLQSLTNFAERRWDEKGLADNIDEGKYELGFGGQHPYFQFMMRNAEHLPNTARTLGLFSAALVRPEMIGKKVGNVFKEYNIAKVFVDGVYPEMMQIIFRQDIWEIPEDTTDYKEEWLAEMHEANGRFRVFMDSLLSGENIDYGNFFDNFMQFCDDSASRGYGRNAIHAADLYLALALPYFDHEQVILNPKQLSELQNLKNRNMSENIFRGAIDAAVERGVARISQTAENQDPVELASTYVQIELFGLKGINPEAESEIIDKLKEKYENSDPETKLEIIKTLLFKRDFGEKEYSGSIRNSELRSWAIEELVDLTSRSIGMDDGSEAYLGEAKEWVDCISQNTEASVRHEVLSSLAHRIQSQERLSKHMEHTISSLSEEDLASRFYLGAGLDMFLAFERQSYKMRAATLDLIMSEGTEEDFAKFGGKYIDAICRGDTEKSERLQKAGTEPYKDLYQSFWSSSFKVRALISRQLLFDYEEVTEPRRFSHIYNPAEESVEELLTAVTPDGIEIIEHRPMLTGEETWLEYRVTANELNTRRFNRVRDSILDRILPENDQNAFSRDLVKVYMQECIQEDPDENTRYSAAKLMLSALMMANNKAQQMDREPTRGEMLCLIAGYLGPAGTKFLQKVKQHPDTPEDIRTDVEHATIMVRKPERWELFNWINERAPELKEGLKRVGSILGAASYGVTFIKEYITGEKTAATVLRPKARQEAAKVLGRMGRTITRMLENYPALKPAVSIVDSTDQSKAVETNMDTAKQQIITAGQRYDGLAVEVDGHIFTFKVMEYLSHGHDHKEVEIAHGIQFDEMESTGVDVSYMKASAKAILITELMMILDGGEWDRDRNGGGQRISPVNESQSNIGMYDFGDMELRKPTAKQKEFLGEVISDCLKKMDQDVPFHETLMSHLSATHDDPEIAEYAAALNTTFLVLNTYLGARGGQTGQDSLLSENDIQDVFMAAVLNADVSKEVVDKIGGRKFGVIRAVAEKRDSGIAVTRDGEDQQKGTSVINRILSSIPGLKGRSADRGAGSGKVIVPGQVSNDDGMENEKGNLRGVITIEMLQRPIDAGSDVSNIVELKPSGMAKTNSLRVTPDIDTGKGIAA